MLKTFQKTFESEERESRMESANLRNKKEKMNKNLYDRN